MSNFTLLLQDKPEGVTSFSSLWPVKREYGKKEKIGHAGTLDKFASGLMICMIGGATKLNPVFSSFGKSYLAEILFGEETDTLDPEGTVIATGPVPSEATVDSVLPSFTGKLKQRPPQYSAVHVDGERAYKTARKGVEIEMPERDIEITGLEKLSYEGGKLRIRVHVSKGTYIRSLARDIAKACGTVGRLEKLRRETVGPFSLSDVGAKSTRELLDMTGLFSTVELDPEHRFEIDNGRMRYSWILSDTDKGKQFCYLYFSGALYAVAEKVDGKIKILKRIDGNL